MADAVLLDVDGTLVDTVYLHVAAWQQAFLEHDVVVPGMRVHAAIGMGGDRLVGWVAGDEVEERLGNGGFWRSPQQQVADEFDRLVER